MKNSGHIVTTPKGAKGTTRNSEPLVKEHPILFSTPMVQAIIAGRKTVTRRIVKLKHLPQKDIASIHPDGSGLGWVAWAGKPVGAEFTRQAYPGNDGFKCPYGEPGDILWVRETHAPWGYDNSYAYKADGFIERYGAWERDTPNGISDIERIEKWTPSIFMPKEACRIWLEITQIRVERLQDISREDALAEGVLNCPIVGPIGNYEFLWEKINGEKSWNDNPFVWVISFQVLSTTGKPDCRNSSAQAI